MGDPKEEDQCPVIKAWMEMPLLVARGAIGQIAMVKKELDRQDVSDNADLLEPLILSVGATVQTLLVIKHRNLIIVFMQSFLIPRYKA